MIRNPINVTIGITMAKISVLFEEFDAALLLLATDAGCTDSVGSLLII